MRRKGITYYLNTVSLKLANRKFNRLRKASSFKKVIAKNKEELVQKYNLSPLNFPEFNLFYKTYFYFKSTSVFDDSYTFENGFPVSLKGIYKVPLIPLYYGLVHINTAFGKEIFDLQKLKDIADYTIKNARKTKSAFLIEHSFDYKIFDLKAPWISGITQAIACSFFVRLYVLTKDVEYLEAAKKFFHPCTTSHQENGCLVVTKSGLEWVEEYYTQPSAFVLSGHIFAIIAAAELFQVLHDKSYKFYTENWLRSLVSELSTYQFKEYIVHNKYQWKLSNIEYQGLYVGQFKHLYELTGNDVFLEFYNFYNKKINWKSFFSFYGIN